MDSLAGNTLQKKSGDLVGAGQALKAVDIVGLFFSAEWCPPCRKFTVTLAEAYKDLKGKGKSFEVVFVSLDVSKEEMKTTMEVHGDWLAVPFGDPLIPDLEQKYAVEVVPTLVIMKKSGEIITMEGRRDISKKGAAAFDAWQQGKAATTEEDQ
uniref:Nucleoredoxin2-1 n=1 Tax=Hemiscolopendra marginata TaxID=943146 RepID=A0A646QCP6_9MYRI